MNNLTKKQKIIFGVTIIIVVIVIGYYFYQNFQETGYEDLNINTTNSEDFKDKDKKEILIHITGAVNKEGVVKLKEGARVIDAIEESGGLLEDANLDKVNLAYPLSDGQKVYIPSVNDEETEQEILQNSENSVIQNISTNPEDSESKVNINTASQTELETLPGIGSSTAYHIMQYRQENGLFNSVDNIKNVPGIGEAKFNQIKDLICVK